MADQRVKAIGDTINQSLPSFAAGFVQPRGIALPLDPWMRGAFRWGRKFGGRACVWRPDITVTLTKVASNGQAVLAVDSIPDSMLSGTVLQLTPAFCGVVSDWDTVAFTITLQQAMELEADLPMGQSILVKSFPVTVNAGALKGSEVIRVTSPLYLAPGDSLEIPVSVGQAQYTTNVRITKVEITQEVGSAYVCYLTLASGLARAVAGLETVYVKAYPLYHRQLIPVPDGRSAATSYQRSGPFLVDWMSGLLMENTSSEEVLTVATRRGDRNIVNAPSVGGHNFQVCEDPFLVEQLLWWDLRAGQITLDGKTIKATLDANGDFRLIHVCKPPFLPAGASASGVIRTTARSAILNNEKVTVPDGITTLTFEFKVNSFYVASSGVTTVDISGVTTAESVASILASAIIASSLKVSVSSSGRFLYLTNNLTGEEGNVTLLSTVASSDFAVNGMGGGRGGLAWNWKVVCSEELTLRFQFHPNAPTDHVVPVGASSLSIPFKSSFIPSTTMDLWVHGSPGALFNLEGWELDGSSVAYLDLALVVRTESNQWAGSFFFVKPLLPNLALLQLDLDHDKTDGLGLLG